MDTTSDLLLITNAHRVRDYLIASGSPLAAELTTALEQLDPEIPPFDPDALAELRKVCARIFPEIDPYTLDAIYTGRITIGSEQYQSRRRRWFRVSNVAALLGFVLMVFSLHFSNWSIRTDTVIRNFDSVLLARERLNLLEMANMIKICEDLDAPVDESDFARYVSAANDLQYFDQVWRGANLEASYLVLSYYPLQWRWHQAVQWFNRNFLTPEKPLPGTRQAQIVPPTASGTRQEPIPMSREFCERYVSDSAPANIRFEGYTTALDVIYSDLVAPGGVKVISALGVAQIEFTKQRLLQLKNVVSRWYLPVLHGALGAVIFCLVRSLSRFTISMTYKELLLRVFFGAFVGFAVSTLLIPSGLLTIEYARPAPVASLMAFVFGYSSDSFLAVLNRLNAYFTAASPPKALSETTGAPPKA